MSEFVKLDIADLILIKPRLFEDERGFFYENYKKSEFIKNGINIDFVQDNHSKSIKNVLRGLHYQEGTHAQEKLVRCISGAIFDVAVDLRKDSKTYGKWFGIELSAENHYMLYIPTDFAHGFYTLSDYAEVHYKASVEYNASSERGIIWNDSTINIEWNLKVEPIISEKDKLLPAFTYLP
jgi:dTDP-4-dehydrorhamnose 3,5-epimerase